MSKEFRCIKCDHINVIGKETKPTLHQMQQSEITNLKVALFKYVNAGCGDGTHFVNQKAALDNALILLGGDV